MRFREWMPVGNKSIAGASARLQPIIVAPSAQTVLMVVWVLAVVVIELEVVVSAAVKHTNADLYQSQTR
jgi:hypothetical protein